MQIDINEPCIKRLQELVEERVVEWLDNENRFDTDTVDLIHAVMASSILNIIAIVTTVARPESVGATLEVVAQEIYDELMRNSVKMPELMEHLSLNKMH